MHRAGARGDEGLMPFIEAGHQCSSQNRDVRPAHRPVRIQRSSRHGQGDAPRPEKENAQNAVANNVACFANVKVPVGEVEPVYPEQEVQHRIQNPAGILGGQQRARFNGDDDQP